MWAKSTKQRRAARARRWAQRRLFRDTATGELFIPGIVFMGGSCPFKPSRMQGWGWEFALNKFAVVLKPGKELHRA